MKKLIAFFILIHFLHFSATADHITGGEMSYTFVGVSNGTYEYRGTLKLYMRCNSGRVFNNPTIISIFRKSDNVRVQDLNVPLSRQETISLDDPDPCISNPPTVCYEVGYYEFNLSLAGSVDGYVVTGQVNYRISTISNLEPGYSQIGASYTMEIPGNALDAGNPKNNSAIFIGSDLVIVCADNPFTYSFGASDADGDVLTYSFCEAYRSSTGPSNGGGNNASAPLSPPYQSVPYGNGFDGSKPLGTQVSIDSKTGLITGIAPSAGVYVVTVCVTEVRNGKVIATQRKDLQIAITSCSLTAAVLPPAYQLCRDTKTIELSNLSISTLINDYYWELKNQAGAIVHTAASPTVSYAFADTGLYDVKLVINRGQRCTDSTTSKAIVFPGFKPAFVFSGICFTKPTIFTDATTSVYGKVNYWHWDFGDNLNMADSSLSQNPSYTFQSIGVANTILVATDTKGCRDTLAKPVQIFEKPPMQLAFRDTLICPPDLLQLKASGRGVYTWSPTAFMINATSGTPSVSPLSTTTYYVELDDDGCKSTDSVTVRVTDKVLVTSMNDTTICAGDAINLRLQTNGLVYNWSPAAQLNNIAAASPVATTNVTTTYKVAVSISKCTALEEIVVKTVPYPTANAGADTIICFASSAQLLGTSSGSRFRWTPSGTLSNNTILNPVASPISSTQYILSVSDTKGCPKLVSDSVAVIVLPDIEAYAGRDTALVLGENLQLQAEGGLTYLWTPATALSAPNIANPIALYNEPANAIRYKVYVFNRAGCVDSAFITIKVFSTKPSVFVPSGFTPNGDGKNDVLRPIAVGMKNIERFTIYNRYGQLVFTTSTINKGWDGRINGQLQQTSSFVWLVEAVDYTGAKYKQKGIVTLIR